MNIFLAAPPSSHFPPKGRVLLISLQSRGGFYVISFPFIYVVILLEDGGGGGQKTVGLLRPRKNMGRKPSSTNPKRHKHVLDAEASKLKVGPMQPKKGRTKYSQSQKKGKKHAKENSKPRGFSHFVVVHVS